MNAIRRPLQRAWRVLGRVLRSPGLRHAPRALAVVCAVEIGLRVMTLPRLADRLGIAIVLAADTCPAAGPDLLGPADAARYVAVRHVLRFWPFGRSGPCLRQALATARLLRHRGAAVQLGAAREGRRAVAHAWVVIDGQALDPGAGYYVPLATVTA